MTTQLEVNIAVMQTQMQQILDDNADARKSRKETHEKLNDIDRRLSAVENHVTSAAPTLAEFVVLKHKVAGAGLFGRWLWAVSGFLIGSAAAIAGFGSAVKAWLLGN